MHLDVQDLHNFYYRSALGRAAQKAVRQAVYRIWPEAKGQSVAGYGFAVPLLRPYLPEARRVVALMPGPQGVMRWPSGLPNVSVLCEETLLPMETGHVDKLMLLHGLETSETPSALLEECWRVLGPGGRALFIVPNRTGMWSRSDRTPFGFGRPYTLSQLETQLRRHAFVPEQHSTALFQPPSVRKFWMRTGALWERTGQRFGSILPGGILLVEAVKRVQAPLGPGEKVTARSPLSVLAPKPEAAVPRRART